MAAAVLTTALLLTQGSCEGWAAAVAVRQRLQDAQQLVLPLAVSALARGSIAAVTASCARRLGGWGGAWTAALAGSGGPCAALLSLARHAAEERSAGQRSDAVAKCTALAAGAGVMLAVQVLAPLAGRAHRGHALRGLLLGLLCACALMAGRQMLCWIIDLQPILKH